MRRGCCVDVGSCRGLEACPYSVFVRCFGGLVGRDGEELVVVGPRERDACGGMAGEEAHCGVLSLCAVC